MILTIARNKIKRIDVINESLTAPEVYAKYKPDWFINGALYDSRMGTNITYMKDEGVKSGYLFTDEGIGVKGDKDLLWCNFLDDVRDFIGGSPILRKNGLVNIDWGNKYSEYVDGKHWRSAIGFDDNKVVLYVSDKEKSLESVAQELDAEFLVNLDGGGSCHLQAGEKVYRKTTRRNASWILIWGEERMKTNEELVIHCELAYLEKWGYVFGTWGLVLTDKLLNQKLAQYPTQVGKYLDHIRDKYMGKRTVDCGGLIKSFLWWNGDNPAYTPSSDASVNTMYAQAKEKGPISTIPEIPGLIVWKGDHAGVYVGNGEVIESKGTIDGVVKTKLRDRPFTHWFKHKDIKYIDTTVEAPSELSDWAIDPHEYVVDKKISDGLRPKDLVTREELWTMLYRLKGE